MSNQLTAIQEEAKRYQQEFGGEIFVFPIEEENPQSLYAVVVYAGEAFHVFSEAVTVEDAAIGVQTILECFEKEGMEKEYAEVVRFITGEAQLNAPHVTMRRLKKESKFVTVPNKFDYFEQGDGYALSARGVLKYTYIAMVQEQLPKAIQFMNKYYRLLVTRGYGKSVAGIKKEVKRMNEDEAIGWLECTYEKYLGNGDEIMNIMNSLK
ncbi:hypothetical protein IIU_06969 [Bacillus cereus VD133]|uniref:Uncharacterized protein n=1 Tax=Bacillus cereus VD133 TaxID=1053233 RepID=A0A9W5PJA2_BACCE|nr:hypothetical protein [Bacillus cereus]EOO23562.1 hypothetical protein IIU_06969 [Bacillus cereus VD133]